MKKMLTVFALASVDRDYRYEVTAGDASRGPYAVRVLRRPAAVSFRVRYTYPSYTGLEPAVVTGTDGTIEAPVGTRAAIAVTATEPLKSAFLVLDNVRVARSSKPVRRL